MTASNLAHPQVVVETLFEVAPAPRHAPSATAARKQLRRVRDRWLAEASRVGFLEDAAPGSGPLAAARRRASRLHDQVLEAMRDLDEAYDQPRSRV